jgi:hypothetical protein
MSIFFFSLLRPLLTSVFYSHLLAKRLAFQQENRSPRVRRVTFLSHRLHLHYSLPDDIGLRVFLHSYPSDNASYAISVRPIKSLPTASFRPYLAIAALAVRLEVPVIKALRDLSSLSYFLACFRLQVACASHGASRHAWRTER